MVLQLEDCMDVLHVINSDKYFTYSSLIILAVMQEWVKIPSIPNRINVGFGGALLDMRPTKVTYDDRFIGRFNYSTQEVVAQLNVGDEQIFIYSKENKLPFLLLPEQRATTRFDQIVGKPKTKQKNKRLLKIELKENSELKMYKDQQMICNR